MKRLFAAALAVITSLAFGATTTPVQLLNPAGSTAGQAIISNGPTSAPTWGAVPLTGITGTLAIGNGGTGATSVSAARTNLGLGTSSTVNTGTSGATVPLLNGANTWSAAQVFTSTITPSQTAGIIGTTTNNNANAGSIGEFQQQVTTGTSLTNSTAANCSSISLSAGDWDIRGTIQFIPTGALTLIWGSINTTSATQNGVTNGGSFLLNAAMTSAQQQIASTRTVRLSLASTTTVYLVGTAAFASGTTTCTGVIEARRVR